MLLESLAITKNLQFNMEFDVKLQSSWVCETRIPDVCHYFHYYYYYYHDYDNEKRLRLLLLRQLLLLVLLHYYYYYLLQLLLLALVLLLHWPTWKRPIFHWGGFSHHCYWGVNPMHGVPPLEIYV